MTTGLERNPKLKNVLPRRVDRLQLYSKAGSFVVVRAFNNLFDGTMGIPRKPDPEEEAIMDWVLDRANPTTAAALEWVDSQKIRMSKEK